MFGPLSFLVFAFTASSAATNRAFPPTKIIKLTLGIAKSTYLPLSGKKFIQNGGIVENPSTILPRFRFGLIPLPPKYDPRKDRIACNIKKWTAKSYENRETEVLMFTNIRQKLVVFGFRGTEALNPVDWYSNLKAIYTRVYIGKSTFLLHSGFRDRYGFIARWFEAEYKKVPQDYTIIITGHSLGGAEATIAAAYAAGKLKRRPDAVVTYGSPLVGTQSFKDYYNKVVGCDRSMRIKAKGDIFTIVPLRLFWYRHVCAQTAVDGKTGFNFLKSHDLFGGYELGIKRKYSNVNEINFGCDMQLLT